jgi:hypothetical protein
MDVHFFVQVFVCQMSKLAKTLSKIHTETPPPHTPK